MQWLAAALVSVALVFPAHASDHDARRGVSPSDVVGGLIQERDVALLFGYLRETLSAAVEGRDVMPSPPDELTRRAEVLGGEMKRRGAAAGHAILDAIESSMRERLPQSDGQTPPSQPGRIRL